MSRSWVARGRPYTADGIPPISTNGTEAVSRASCASRSTASRIGSSTSDFSKLCSLTQRGYPSGRVAKRKLQRPRCPEWALKGPLCFADVYYGDAIAHFEGTHWERRGGDARPLGEVV
jgi:hypothetical protein